MNLVILKYMSGTSLYCTDQSITSKKHFNILSDQSIASQEYNKKHWLVRPKHTSELIIVNVALQIYYLKNAYLVIDTVLFKMQDAGTDTWSSKIARHIIKFGNISIGKQLFPKTTSTEWQEASEICCTAQFKYISPKLKRQKKIQKNIIPIFVNCLALGETRGCFYLPPSKNIYEQELVYDDRHKYRILYKAQFLYLIFYFLLKT